MVRANVSGDTLGEELSSAHRLQVRWGRGGSSFVWGGRLLLWRKVPTALPSVQTYR